MQTVGIIGAGIAGLASAIRLAHAGYAVQVFEANAYPGGKLTEIQLGDYRFDAGPSLFTMPQYVEELFALTQVDMAPYFDYAPLDTVCNYFWEDGTTLSAYADTEQYAQEVERVLGVPQETLRRALAISAKKYQATGEIFIRKSLHKWQTWWSKDVARALPQIPQLDIFTTMHKANERLLKHPKLVQLFNRYATYNGSNPYQASGILNIIPHLEHGFGAYYPKGGMQQITQALYQLALKLGVKFHFKQRVDEILLTEHIADGLRIDTQRLSFDKIVCNMDVFFAYQRLLPHSKPPKRLVKQEKSSSALIFYWGIARQFPQLDVHNIFFADDYRTEFEHLFKHKTLYTDPTVYINITSKYTPEDAPKGCENWFTMINVPHLDGQDWTAYQAQARQHILQKLQRILGVDIEPLIVCEDILSPLEIQSRTQSHLGSLYGSSSNDRMAAFARHPNFSTQLKNLYFCGGSVHPGGGIPLCLSSAKIVADLMGPSA